jgi:hypothetical protein
MTATMSTPPAAPAAPAASLRLQAEVGDGWLLTLERHPELGAPDPQRIAQAIVAVSHILDPPAETTADGRCLPIIVMAAADWAEG